MTEDESPWSTSRSAWRRWVPRRVERWLTARSRPATCGIVRLTVGIEHAADLHLRGRTLGRPLLHPADSMRSTAENGLVITVCDHDREKGLQRLDRVIDAVVFAPVGVRYHARRPDEPVAAFVARAGAGRRLPGS